MNENSQGGPRLGAYGLILEGLPGAAPWMQLQDVGAPRLRLHVHPLDQDLLDTPSELTGDAARLQLIGGGNLVFDRDSHDAHYYLSERPSDEDLLHPYVAPAAALFWQWRGKEAMHGGVYVVPDGAVLVLGEKEAGKSTTLGWLATDGATTVLTDDLAVIDGRDVLAGPRSIDLRMTEQVPGVSAHLVRHGERDRIRLAAAPDRLPLVGIVLLDWGPNVQVEPLEFTERIFHIGRQRTFPSLDPNAVSLLDLASTPAIRARRPRDLRQLPEFCRTLVDYFS
jgi:hypothetical protein